VPGRPFGPRSGRGRHPEWLHVYTRILKSVGYHVDVASDVASASEKAKEGYDVIVTDIVMPGLDGIELLRRIHQFDPDVPVILITGHPEVESAMNAVDLGAFKYLSKPVAAETILTTVQEAFRLHRLARLKGEALVCWMTSRSTSTTGRQRRSETGRARSLGLHRSLAADLGRALAGGEDLANLARQLERRDRLLEEGQPGGEDSVTQHGLVRIAGHAEHLHADPDGAQALGELGALM